MLSRRVLPSLLPTAPSAARARRQTARQIWGEERGRLPVPVRLWRTVDGVDVLHEQLLVQVALQVAHAEVQLGLLLGLERLFHVQLQAAEQERLEQLRRAKQQRVSGRGAPPGM